METQQKLTIGLYGFGVVGEGLYKVLGRTPSFQAIIKKICIRQAGKKRNAPQHLFTTDRNVILEDPEINVVVELIDDADAAFDIVRTSLLNRKHVVSANKKMLAEHFTELLELQRSTGCSLLYEAAACASIPVIRNLEEYYDNDLLHSLTAIVNGSTNFILTRIIEDEIPFREALLLAQQSGFAESNPALDITGQDAANKWSFLLTHAYGIAARTEDFLFAGIENIQPSDAAIARARNEEVKLVAQAKKISNGNVAAFVLPQFVSTRDHLAFVKDEYNGVVIESGFADKQFFYGKGAGSLPTASAVLSDISALRYGYKYEYKKLLQQKSSVLEDDFLLRTYVSFNNWDDVPRDEFEWIEEWHANEDRNYLIGVIHYNKLKSADWWKTNGSSLILMPDAVIEDDGIRKLKKRSLELALGV